MELISPAQQAINLIRRSKKILILPSSPPDGDSLGSALSLYLALKKLNKISTVVCADPVPEVYNFLPSEKVIKNSVSLSRDFIVTLDCSKAEVDNIRYQVEHNKVNIIISPKKGNFSDNQVSFNHGSVKYDLIIVVDAGDLSQVGPLYEHNPELFYDIPVINIDHHASNNGYGKVNLIDVAASATCELIYKLLLKLDDKNNVIDENIATALLAGIITDTGSFQNANTTPRSLEIASELVNLGARQQEIIKHVYKTKKLTTLKLWGKVLTKIKYSQKYRLVWSVITQKDFEETKTGPEDSGDIMDDLMTNTPGAEIALLLKERKPGLLSGSLRTISPTVSADEIADLFGGGGHTQAAGFRFETGNFKNSVEEVIKKIKDYQKQRLHLEDDEPEIYESASMNDQERDKWYEEVGPKVIKDREILEQPETEQFEETEDEFEEDFPGLPEDEELPDEFAIPKEPEQMRDPYLQYPRADYSSYEQAKEKSEEGRKESEKEQTAPPKSELKQEVNQPSAPEAATPEKIQSAQTETSQSQAPQPQLPAEPEKPELPSAPKLPEVAEPAQEQQTNSTQADLSQSPRQDTQTPENRPPTPPQEVIVEDNLIPEEEKKDKNKNNDSDIEDIFKDMLP